MRCLPAEADIDLPEILDKSFENDRLMTCITAKIDDVRQSQAAPV
jgi:hypothetical protein